MVKDVKRAELVSAVRRVAQGQLVLGGSLLNTPGITESALGHLRTMLNGRQQTRSTSTIPHQSEPSTSDSKLLLRRQVSADIQGPQRDQNVRKLTTGVPAPPVSSSPTNSEALALEERRSNKEFSTPDLGTTEGEDGLSFNDKGDEPTPAPRTKASALYESMIELAIAPPMEADTLLRFCEWLTKTTRAEIQETSGSWQEGTSLKVLLRRPLPLLEMLANSPDVIQVWEEPSEKQSMIRRFLPQRTPESAPISEPTTKLQVLLRTGSGPKQLHLAFDSPNSP